MSGFLDSLKEALGGAAEGALDVTSRIRYGMPMSDKDELVYGRKLPGAPSYSEGPEAAERYASSYLGAKKWGRLPAEIFNAIAFADFTKPRQLSDAVKGEGARGAEMGDIARQKDEMKRRERLAGLFRGERIG